MKQLLQQYAGYNLWANKTITAQILLMPEQAIHHEIISSFSSIYKTVVHMANVENIWWQRLKLAEHVVFVDEKFSGSMDNVVQHFLQVSQLWKDWVSNANEANITHVFGYQTSKKELFKQPVYELLMQVFNHQTYHRGQLVTMMRQAGQEKIAQTDYILYSRNPSLQKK